MQFSAVFLSLLSISSALPLQPRQETSRAPQLLSTIKELNTAVVGLTTAVNAFDGSIFGLLPQLLEIVKTEATVDVTTIKATYITKQSSNFTAAESSEVVSSLATQIGPIQDSLNALKAKYPVFKKTLTRPIVLLDLNTLKKHTDELIDAVTAKVTPDNAGLLGLGKGILDGAFDDAIKTFSA